ncbi:MAG: hypothetical protein M1820_007911 [Bogoriella megaspora]|nr:MAG: hypothetical protein M1820_007911 [Bogoriella megaspora]
MGQKNGKRFAEPTPMVKILDQQKMVESIKPQAPTKARPVYPQYIDVSIKVPEAPGQQVPGQELLFKHASRKTLIRFSAVAKETLINHPENKTLVVEGFLNRFASEILLGWMLKNTPESQPAPLALEDEANNHDFAKNVLLYSAAVVFQVPQLFTRNLRKEILDFIAATPLKQPEIKLVWTYLADDNGIYNLLTKKLVAFEEQGVYSEVDKAAIYDYVATVPILQDRLNSIVVNREAFIARQARREKKAIAQKNRATRQGRYEKRKQESAERNRAQWVAVKNGERPLDDEQAARLMGRLTI